MDERFAKQESLNGCKVNVNKRVIQKNIGTFQDETNCRRSDEAREDQEGVASFRWSVYARYSCFKKEN